jgi:hypothetical protein
MDSCAERARETDRDGGWPPKQTTQIKSLIEKWRVQKRGGQLDHNNNNRRKKRTGVGGTGMMDNI